MKKNFFILCASGIVFNTFCMQQDCVVDITAIQLATQQQHVMHNYELFKQIHILKYRIQQVLDRYVRNKAITYDVSKFTKYANPDHWYWYGLNQSAYAEILSLEYWSYASPHLELYCPWGHFYLMPTDIVGTSDDTHQLVYNAQAIKMQRRTACISELIATVNKFLVMKKDPSSSDYLTKYHISHINGIALAALTQGNSVIMPSREEAIAVWKNDDWKEKISRYLLLEDSTETTSNADQHQTSKKRKLQ